MKIDCAGGAGGGGGGKPSPCFLSTPGGEGEDGGDTTMDMVPDCIEETDTEVCVFFVFYLYFARQLHFLSLVTIVYVFILLLFVCYWVFSALLVIVQKLDFPDNFY